MHTFHKFFLSLICVLVFLLMAVTSFAQLTPVPSPTINTDRPVRPLDDGGLSAMFEILNLFLPGGSGSLQQGLSPDNSGNVGVGTSGSQTPPTITATAVTSLRQLFTEIEGKVGVPARILEGVLLIESPALLKNLKENEIDAYSQPGATVPNCRPNVCSAAGPMQMTIGVDNNGSSACRACGITQCPNAWVVYGNSVNKNGGYAHQSNVCNLRDNIYGAAAKLKNDSGNKGSGAWTQAQVFEASRRYYGSCSDKYRYERLGGRTYCEFVWWYYKNSK